MTDRQKESSDDKQSWVKCVYRTAIKKLKMVYQKELWYTIFKFIKATQCLAYEKINYSTNLEYFETSPDSISFKVRISPSTSTE